MMVGVRTGLGRRRYAADASPSNNKPQPSDETDDAVPGDVPSGTPSRWKSKAALLTAVACTVFGSKLVVIWALGSPMPLLDQWDGEAARLYAPYLKGALSFADLLAPHNEHRILLTRVLELIHLELAGEWNPRLESILNAAVHTVLITWLVALLMPLVAPRRRILLAGFVALLFAVPIGYENTLWGFQSHLYFTLLFGTAALVAFAAARAFSLRWFGGLAAAALSYLSFATGVATILAAAILVSLQLAASSRKRSGPEFAAVVVMVSVAVARVLVEAPRAVPTSTPWTFVKGLILLAAPAIVGLIPAAWLCRRTLASRPAISDRAWVAVGISCWVPLQLALVAYGRGAVVAVRYLDIVLLVYPAALVAVLAFADESSAATRLGRYARPLAATWLVVVGAAIALLGCFGSVRGAIDWSNSVRQQMGNVQSYLATGNVDYLKPTGGDALTIDLYYPHPERLATVLESPDVRAILPAELRPADADNAEARTRLLLRGALAGVTATAVRLVLPLGPGLLGLGVVSFCAAGARRSGRVVAVG